MKKTNEKILIISKNEGITLIALIITIIVLLILAGVAISAAVGDNGVLNQATEASDKTEEERILEEIQLSVAAYQAGVYAGTETRTLGEYLKSDLDITAARESELGTIIFKLNDKVIVLNDYDTIKMTIKEYQPNTLANNAKNIIDGGNVTISQEIGFLTDDGIARKYIKEISFNTTNTVPNSYDYSWDVSEIADGTVMAYAIGDEINGYNVTIVADGEIYLPENSTSLFRYCGYNENLPEYDIDLNGLNTSKVTDMCNLFCDFGYYSMTNFNLGDSFNTSNVTNMEGMFGRCGYMKLETIDLGDKFNTSNVTNMNSMFLTFGRNSITSLNLGEKFNTSNVTSMRSMFWDCGRFSMVYLDLGDNFDTSNVTDMENMFIRCGYMSMESLDLGNKFIISSGLSAKNVFLECGYSNMKEINFGNAFNEMSEATDLTDILVRCGTSTCKYYVSSETAQNWLLNLDSAYRRAENWNTEYIVVL